MCPPERFSPPDAEFKVIALHTVDLRELECLREHPELGHPVLGATIERLSESQKGP